MNNHCCRPVLTPFLAWLHVLENNDSLFGIPQQGRVILLRAVGGVKTRKAHSNVYIHPHCFQPVSLVDSCAEEPS